MLILSRKAGEEIQIDGHITVTVLGVEGKRVKLGIEAPREIPVVRRELKAITDIPSGILSCQQSLDRLAVATHPSGNC